MHGQTTAQEGGLGPGAYDIARVRNAIDEKLPPIDLYIVAKDTATDDTINAAYSIASEYNKHPEGTSLKLLAGRPDLDIRHINRVRLGGIKLWLDGSPDSCWMTKPFAANPPGKEGAFMSCQQIPDAVLDAAFDKYWTINLQINMHMLGACCRRPDFPGHRKGGAEIGDARPSSRLHPRRESPRGPVGRNQGRRSHPGFPDDLIGRAGGLGGPSLGSGAHRHGERCQHLLKTGNAVYLLRRCAGLTAALNP
jgi:hypothetical protein